ncbi:putative quinol monooxygenase [Pararhodobacter oceanensis]|uniref:putative quinol monooxygenase n=1 Tax=Pararhodobacter oceanensis TaxID=2172121 RepID=UPI003A9022A1
MAEFIVVARILAEPGHEAHVRAEIERLAAPTRQEPGCLRYDIYRHEQDARASLIYEVWESVDHWRRHLATEHLQAFKQNTLSSHATMSVDKFPQD